MSVIFTPLERLIHILSILSEHVTYYDAVVRFNHISSMTMLTHVLQDCSLEYVTFTFVMSYQCYFHFRYVVSMLLLLSLYRIGVRLACSWAACSLTRSCGHSLAIWRPWRRGQFGTGSPDSPRWRQSSTWSGSARCWTTGGQTLDPSPGDWPRPKWDKSSLSGRFCLLVALVSL